MCIRDSAAYIGLSASNTHKLQSILNAAARLIGGIPKFAHISGYIRDTLHWLPIQQRVNFKILSLMRNCLVGVAPSYLRSFCTFVSSLTCKGLFAIFDPWPYGCPSHALCYGPL